MATSEQPADPSHDDVVASPLGALGVLAAQEVALTPSLAHLELYTRSGLLTVLWHGPRDAPAAVLACGGAMGGLLGPAEGLYHDLGTALGEHGIGVLRVGYRRPNDLQRCTHDLIAAADLAGRVGARRFVTVGHSFGGAIAVRAGVMLHAHCRGVVTLATQSAGCEPAGALTEAGTPLLLLHGERDEILPLASSEAVHALAGGTGELVRLPGTGHLMNEAAAELRDRLGDWIPARLAD